MGRSRLSKPGGPKTQPHRSENGYECKREFPRPLRGKVDVRSRPDEGSAPARNKRSDPTFRFLGGGAEKIPRPRTWCAYFEHAPFPNGRLPGGLAADLIHSLLACRIPCGQGKMQGISAIQPFSR